MFSFEKFMQKKRKANKNKVLQKSYEGEVEENL